PLGTTMSAASELDVMRVIDDQLSKIEDPSTKLRILRWAWEKFGNGAQADGKASFHGTVAAKQARAKNGGGPPKVKALSIVKDLNLKPDGKPSFADTVKNKNPSSH